MKNVLANALNDIVKEPTKHDQDYKGRLVEGSLVADLVEAGSKDVPSKVWTPHQYNGRELYIVEFTKFKGMTDGRLLKMHIRYTPELAYCKWEVDIYVLPNAEADTHDALSYMSTSGTSAKAILNDIAPKIASVVESAKDAES